MHFDESGLGECSWVNRRFLQREYIRVSMVAKSLYGYLALIFSGWRLVNAGDPMIISMLVSVSKG
jgi:hypothetical protein